MISQHRRIRSYCSDPLSMVENYELAVKDDKHLWVIHHRNEIANGVSVSSRDLIDKNLYWHRPASELVFMRDDEHRRLHIIGNKYCAGKKNSLGREVSQETRTRIREKMKDKCVPVSMTRNGETMEFPSIHNAVQWLRDNGYPKAIAVGIRTVCDNPLRSAYGARWRYV